MIIDAIKNAFAQAKEKHYPSIYWCIDLHGTCFKSNYSPGKFEWINDKVLPALEKIQKCPKTTIILWTSCHKKDYYDIMQFFAKHRIIIGYINENPEVENTKTGNFKKKFYLSIGIDDKFGFDPETDWCLIKNYLNELEDE